MEACETSSEIMEAWIFKVWNLESNGFQSKACLQIWGSPYFLSQESRPIVLSTAIFHEFAGTSSTCVLTQIKDSRNCYLQKNHNDRPCSEIMATYIKPFHLDFRLLSGPTEMSVKCWSPFNNFYQSSSKKVHFQNESWPFLHLLKKLRCIFFGCEDAKLKLGWIVGILHGWIDNNLSSTLLIKVMYLKT